jgi:hypothetical protein
MRNKLRALYYPDFFADFVTIVKSILLFDETHFMDRPAFTFYVGEETLGYSVRHLHLDRMSNHSEMQEFLFYAHQAPGGPVAGEFLEQIKTDVSDKQFLSRFQEGLRTSRRHEPLLRLSTARTLGKT